MAAVTRLVTFDNINRYYFMLMAYPLKSHIQPFIGIGWGIQVLSNLQVQGSFIDADAQQANQSQARKPSAVTASCRPSAAWKSGSAS